MADLPITSDEGATPVVLNDPVTTANVANVTAAGALKVDGNLTQVGSSAVSLNQKTAASSIPVVIATDQTAIPVSQGNPAISTLSGWPIIGGTKGNTTASWTNATSINTAVTLATNGYTSVFVVLNQTTTITGGAVTFEVSDTAGFTNAYTVNAVPINDPDFITAYTLQDSVNQAFFVNVRGAAAFRIRLSTVISGTGSVNVAVQANTFPGDPWISGTVNSELFDSSGVGLTSTTEGPKQAIDTVTIAPVTNYFSAPVAIRQSAATASGGTVWTMRNPVGSAKTVYIERIYLIMAFDAASPLTRSLQRYDLERFTTATPTGGTAISVVPMDSNAASTVVTDVRFLDTGLTTTSVVFLAPFVTVGCPASDGASVMYVRELTGFKLAAGEGFAIRLTVAAVIGQDLTGEIVWSER